MNKMSFAIAFAGVLPLLLQCAAAQTLHVVGDTIGWTIPQNGAAAYQTWSSNNKFLVGDTLQFNFQTNAHDLLEVPKESYDSCSSDKPIGTTITMGPVNVTINTAGDHYYICTFGQHCQKGQKLAITVSASPGVSPPSTTTPPNVPSPTSPNNANCTPVPALAPNPMNGGQPSPNSGAGVFASFFLLFLSLVVSMDMVFYN